MRQRGRPGRERPWQHGWRRSSGPMTTAQIIITNGAQHGLACVLGAIARPGDSSPYRRHHLPGHWRVVPLARSVLKPVAMDRGRHAARGSGGDVRRARTARGVPGTDAAQSDHDHAQRRAAAGDRSHCPEHTTCRSSRMMSTARSEPDAPPPFIATAPDITVYVSGFSKCVAPGLRIGVVLAPKRMVADIAAMLRINCWSTSPLNALVAARMIEDGLVDRVVAGQRDEFMHRQALVRNVLADFDAVTDDASPHAWLDLPEPWQGNAFARAAAQSGVGVLPGEAFAVGRDQIPHAVRINVGAARSREDLRRALEALRDILSGGRRVFDSDDLRRRWNAISTEIAIIGGGVIGLAAAIRLAGDGREVADHRAKCAWLGRFLWQCGHDRRLRRHPGGNAGGAAQSAVAASRSRQPLIDPPRSVADAPALADSLRPSIASAPLSQERCRDRSAALRCVFGLARTGLGGRCGTPLAAKWLPLSLCLQSGLRICLRRDRVAPSAWHRSGAPGCA